MSVPPDLAARIDAAVSALYQHPERTLTPAWRRDLYAALGERVHGQRRRVRLDLLAARRVLFCWRPLARGKWRAAADLPERLLALAEATLRGTADRRVVEDQLDRAEELAFLTGELETSPHYCEWCVFEAALRALASAYDYDADRDDTARRSALGDVARDDDAARYAAIAVGGGTWHPVIDDMLRVDERVGTWDWRADEVRLRRAVFWEWWLREAIPVAWG